MNLVDLLIARQTETPIEWLERFNREQKRQWKDDGNRLYERRLCLGLSRSFIGRETRVDTNRLRRLEQGLPVREARIIYRSYEMVLEKIEMERT